MYIFTNCFVLICFFAFILRPYIYHELDSISVDIYLFMKGYYFRYFGLTPLLLLANKIVNMECLQGRIA